MFGFQTLTLTPAFPTHNGQDAITATKLGFLSGTIADHNGNGALSEVGNVTVPGAAGGEGLLKPGNIACCMLLESAPATDVQPTCRRLLYEVR